MLGADFAPSASIDQSSTAQWRTEARPPGWTESRRLVFTWQLLQREILARRRTFRGSIPTQDGQLTLVVVDYWCTDSIERLIRSFRKFGTSDGPVIAVRNSPARLRIEGVRNVGIGLNIGHSYALDLAMRDVQTEFTLVCDPDTMITSSSFFEHVRQRIRHLGVVGADSHHAIFHPQCLAFRTEFWKRGGFSFLERWPWWDVAGELTNLVGGIRAEALLPLTASGGRPQKGVRADTANTLGQVFAESFTATQFLTRVRRRPHQLQFDGWSREEVERYHLRWSAWCDRILADEATLADFPA